MAGCIVEQDLLIWIVEPKLTEKEKLSAARLFEATHGITSVAETISIDDIKQQLKEIRRDARDNASSLLEELRTTLSQKYPKVKVKLAEDNVDAATYISEIAEGANTISTNNSSIVTQELKPELIKRGFMVINSYADEFHIEERKIHDYWELPPIYDNDPRETFEVAIKMAGLPDIETKKYLAVLGVNAISAEDGTVLFLQHLSNIHKDLRQASKVILVVGLDKIVKTRQQAAFQTQCMGIFGRENILLGITPKPDGVPAIDELPLPPGGKERELHLILLDNGRTRLLQGKFQDLFLCIGCRACNKHCPIRHSLANADFIWTPKNYLAQFLNGTTSSIDICLHCESCHIDCPVDINLPYLMWQAKIDHITRQGVSFQHKLLGMPEVLAKLGTALAPVSNWMMGLKLARIPMEIISGIDRRAKLPRFHSQTFQGWFKKHDQRFTT